MISGGDVAPGEMLLDFIELSSTGNAVDFGDMTSRTQSLQEYFKSRGLWGGGQTPSIQNTIDKVEISLGNAVDYGDLSVARMD